MYDKKFVDNRINGKKRGYENYIARSPVFWTLKIYMIFQIAEKIVFSYFFLIIYVFKFFHVTITPYYHTNKTVDKSYCFRFWSTVVVGTLPSVRKSIVSTLKTRRPNEISIVPSF